jgi:hypothetical protein
VIVRLPAVCCLNLGHASPATRILFHRASSFSTLNLIPQHFIKARLIQRFLKLFCSVAQEPKSFLGYLTVEVSRSHTIWHSHARAIGLVQTIDILFQDTATYTRGNNRRNEHSCPQRGSNPRSQQ